MAGTELVSHKQTLIMNKLSALDIALENIRVNIVTFGEITVEVSQTELLKLMREAQEKFTSVFGVMQSESKEFTDINSIAQAYSSELSGALSLMPKESLSLAGAKLACTPLGTTIKYLAKTFAFFSGKTEAKFLSDFFSIASEVLCSKIENVSTEYDKELDTISETGLYVLGHILFGSKSDNN